MRTNIMETQDDAAEAQAIIEAGILLDTEGAAKMLGISPRTIEDHRANIMKKLGARNAADLVRIVMTTQRQA